jgi:DNA-binding winged helix-turn-helix (wHTH) protein
VRASDQIRVLHFPPFRLDLVAGQLLRGEEPIAIRQKTSATLCHLAARPGEGVTKDDLLVAVWPDVSVTDDVPRFSVRVTRSCAPLHHTPGRSRKRVRRA